MIVAIVGSVMEDTTAVVEAISDFTEVQTVDGVRLFRELPEVNGKSLSVKIINHLPVSSNYKKLFLKSMENTYGEVIISGNLLLDESVLHWILSEGGAVGVVTGSKLEEYPISILEDTLKYYVDKSMQKYELETRWNLMYERLQKTHSDRVYLLNLYDSESEELTKLIELISSESKEHKKESNESPMEVLVNITNSCMEVNNMGNISIEESIKKAMAELGMEVEGEELVKSEKEPVVVTKPKTKKEKKENPKPPVKEKTKVEVEDTENTTEESDSPTSIFCKISGSNMALLIPEGLTLEKRTIGNMKFDVATVSIPDFTSGKLQELPMVVETPKQPKLSSIMNPPENSTSKAKKTVETSKQPDKQLESKSKTPRVKTEVIEKNLDELRAEKARLDSEIKAARENRDLEKVELLRKQRRAVRKKINMMKE